MPPLTAWVQKALFADTDPTNLGCNKSAWTYLCPILVKPDISPQGGTCTISCFLSS